MCQTVADSTLFAKISVPVATGSLVEMTQTFESRDHVACITRTNDIDKVLVEIVFQISYKNRGVRNEGERSRIATLPEG